MRKTSLLLVVASASLILAACDQSSDTAKSASKAVPPAPAPVAAPPSTASAAPAAPAQVAPADSCNVSNPTTIPYDDTQEPQRWLRSKKHIREMPSLGMFLTDAPNTVTKLKRDGSYDCNGKEHKVFPDCSVLQIKAGSGSHGAMTLMDGSTTMVDQLAVKPHQGKTGIDFLQSDEWTDPKTTHKYTFYVYMQDANDSANNLLKKHYLVEAFDSDGSCDDKRPDRNGNISDAPNSNVTGGNETDTTHGHEGNP